MTMVVDYSTMVDMKSVPISQAKTHLLALLAEVQRSQEPILVTKRGKPIARIEPFREQKRRKWAGYLKGEIRILGDIMSPACPPEDWEALRE